MKKNLENLLQTWPDERIMEEFLALRVGYGLKRTLRYDTKRDFSEHSESVAEHLFALNYLALYFGPLEDPKGELDMSKVSRIITFHDFGEITHGDVPYHVKTEAHEKQEHEDARVLFDSLPASLKKVARDSWQEYIDQESKESQFVYALDKVEPLFELFDPVNERSLKRSKFSYKAHFHKKYLATEEFPFMRRFVDVVSKDMLDRKVFWEE